MLESDDLLYKIKAFGRRWQRLLKLVRQTDKRHRVSLYGYFTTPPSAVHTLLAHEHFDKSTPISEPCAGNGAISMVLESLGYTVKSSDIRSHTDAYGSHGVDVFDLVDLDAVITNPPVNQGVDIAKHLVSHARGKVALLLRADMDGVMSRHEFFLYPARP